MDYRNPRKQDNGKRGIPRDLRLHNTSPNLRDYSLNDRDVRHGNYGTGFFPNDRAGGADRWRDKSRSLFQNPTRPKYDSFHTNLNNKNNNDQKFRMNDEELKKRSIGVEYNVTSDKGEIVWQNKEQVDLYGLVGGGRRNSLPWHERGWSRQSTDKCRTRSLSRQSRDKCRTRSLSRQPRDKTKKPLLGILKRSSSRPTDRRRSRSVCFSENNTFFEFEHDAEMDDVSKNDMTINNKKYGISEEKSKVILASGKSNNMEEATICPSNLKKSYVIPPLNLDKEDGDCFTSNLVSEEAFICSQTLDSKPLLKINKKDKVNAKHQRKFHGFDEKDISDDFGWLEMRTLLIQMQNKYEEDCQEFADNTYDVIVESTLGDNTENTYDITVDSTLADNTENTYDVIVESTLGDSTENTYDITVESTLADNTENTYDVIVESTLGDNTENTYDITVDSTLADNTENTYDVIVESTLADRNQNSHEIDQLEVQNETAILENNDSFRNYLIPIEDIFEDDTGHIVDANEPFMKYQDEEFNRETNLALTNMLTVFDSNEESSHMRPPADTDLPLPPQNMSSLDRRAPLQTDSNSEDNGQVEHTPPIQVYQQQLTQETKMDQSFLELKSTNSVSQRPTENETSKTDEEDNCIGVLAKDVNVKENESDLVNHCLQKLNLYNLDQKTAYFKMKPVRICVEKIRLSKGDKKRLISNILKLKRKPFKTHNPQVGALKDRVQLQCASSVGDPALATTIGSDFSHVAVKTQNPSRISVGNAATAATQLRKLRNSVQCSVCGTRVPAASSHLKKKLEDTSTWQCEDCTVCVVCFVRDDKYPQQLEDGDSEVLKEGGGRLLVCGKCGYHYHKACVHLEEELQVGSSYVCQFCTTEKN